MPNVIVVAPAYVGLMTLIVFWSENNIEINLKIFFFSYKYISQGDSSLILSSQQLNQRNRERAKQRKNFIMTILMWHR